MRKAARMPNKELSETKRHEEALRKALNKAIRAVLKPPPTLTLSEWSEKYFYLPEGSALPGRFRFDRAPYQRGVFDALSDNSIRSVVIMAAVQTLKTQSILNYIGYIIDLDPAPILMVQPTKELAQTISKDRIDPMLKDVPALLGKVADKRDRDGGNTMYHKTFAGGSLSIATAGSPTELASRPIRYLFCDEVDKYKGTTEGSPIDLARARTTTYWNSKEVIISSPTHIDASIIADEYSRSDKRIYMVPCNECGAEQELAWKGVKWDKDDSGIESIHLPETTYYECEHCLAQWDDSQRNTNIAYGRWVATNPSSPVAGFHLSAFYSSFEPLSKYVYEFLAAQGDNEKLQTWTNTREAKPWEPASSTVNDTNWLSRQEPYTPNKLPNEVLLITAGIDVQHNRLEMEVVGWGIGNESWSVEYLVIVGDPSSPVPWEQLADVLKRTYKREDRLPLRIATSCIDTGGHWTTDVMNFTRTAGKTCLPIIGRHGQGKPIFPPKSKKAKAGGYKYHLGVDTAKERIMYYLNIDTKGPGYCHFPDTYDEYYFEGITSERRLVTRTRGVAKISWIKKKGASNEPLDCRVYATAARESMSHLDMNRRAEMLTKKAESYNSEPVEETEEEMPHIPTYAQRNPPTRRSRRNNGALSKIRGW